MSIANETPKGTLLLGKKLIINGVPVGIKIDDGLDALSATDRLHSGQGDGITNTNEATNLDARWIITAHAGLEKKLKLGTLFASGGLAVARVSDTVIDIDVGVTPQENINNFPNDGTIQLGWIVGLGAELLLDRDAENTSQGNQAWILRMEGAYINLEGDNDTNPSGGNSCESGNSLSLCSYNNKGETGVVRFAIIRRF